jgi:hypothetical protein
MYSVHQTIELRRGQNTLTITAERVEGVVRNVGCVDGHGYVSPPTREGAVQALLRRIYTSIPSGLPA